MELTDIRQGINGDCFILSSIVSILDSFGSGFISNIFESITEHDGLFCYYNKINNKLIRKCEVVTYEAAYILSPKSHEWVKKIENAYIKLFYKGDIDFLLQNGGIAFDVLERLTGLSSQILINRSFDNKESIYYELCRESIMNNTWSTEFVKFINIITKWKYTVFIEKFWNILLKGIGYDSVESLEPGTVYKPKLPCVIGINSIFNNIVIPGIINDHLYSIVGVVVDEDKNRYIHAYNPHYNVDARLTKYDKNTKKYISEIYKQREGVWSIYELAIFCSDFTYSVRV